jgi:hypothetical protein
MTARKSARKKPTPMPARIPSETATAARIPGRFAVKFTENDIHTLYPEIEAEARQACMECARFSDLPFYAVDKYKNDPVKLALLSYALGQIAFQAMMERVGMLNAPPSDDPAIR